MKYLIFTSFILLFIFNSCFCQTKPVVVFSSKLEVYKSYRIPAIINLQNGDLLAFAEGRVHHAGDFGDVNIVMKKSKDKGKTWSPILSVVDYDSLQAGNPAPVVDISDPLYPNGRIFLFYNTGNNHEGEVRKGKGYREVWYKTSIDGGNTWSDAVNITTQVHRPNQPQINPAYNFKEDWRSYANTPGHAMQFERGKYKGRIFVAANHSEGNPKPQFTDYYAHGFFTDDHGKTFQLSDNVNLPGSNESTAAPLYNGGLIMNSRNQDGEVKARIVSISSNGGASWDTTYFDFQLPDPVNEGSILPIRLRKKSAILAFCNAASKIIRDSLTLRISFNAGRTWKKEWLIDASGKSDNTAYSDLVLINKKKIGILYEKENYSRIVFTTIRWKSF